MYICSLPFCKLHWHRRVFISIEIYCYNPSHTTGARSGLEMYFPCILLNMHQIYISEDWILLTNFVLLAVFEKTERNSIWASCKIAMLRDIMELCCGFSSNWTRSKGLNFFVLASQQTIALQNLVSFWLFVIIPVRSFVMHTYKFLKFNPQSRKKNTTYISYCNKITSRSFKDEFWCALKCFEF
jgi:hypothetical protein